MRVLLSCALFLLFGGSLLGQAIIEYGKAAAGTTGAAGSVKSTGASVGKIFEKVSGTVSKGSASTAGQAAASTTPASRSVPAVGTGSGEYSLAPVVAAPKKRSQADFASVEIGMTRDELVAKVGKPFFSTTSSGPDGTVEVLEYDTIEGVTVKVRVAGWRVFAMETQKSQMAAEIAGPGFVSLSGRK